MKDAPAIPHSFRTMAVLFVACAAASAAGAQRGPSTPWSDSLRTASKLDLDLNYAKARPIFQKLIETAPDPAAKAQAQRAMAISYAFTSDCLKAAELEDQVVAYWQTREEAEPQNAFYQEGEVSNEAARICFDAANYGMAEKLYRRGTALGLKEPAPRTHPASLWNFRLAHALARIDVRVGKTIDARLLVERARKILDGDKAMAVQQERFFPYLEGYVEFYAPHANDKDGKVEAERLLRRAVDFPGNENDPYVNWLLAAFYANYAYSADLMMEFCHKAVARATVHNPPSAFVLAHQLECLDPQKNLRP